VKLALSKFGKLDIAVNCAGIFEGEMMLGAGGKPHSLATFNKARLRATLTRHDARRGGEFGTGPQIIAVNLSGTFNVCRLAAAAMAAGTPDAKRDGERGVIINTAS
jgi:NAD(P)-dependent dehydrogenase (short-subunit alcohol dehydrogenase family)